MKFLPKPHLSEGTFVKQCGVVLFFALISLLAIMLAAVALIRSVDTSTMIAGNLAFKQAATTSGDAGTEAAVAWLAGMETANIAKNVLTDRTHRFNLTCLVVRAPASLDVADPGCPAVIPGYHSSADPALVLTAGTTWNDTNSVLVATDSSGNTIRYVIQRTCRNANVTIQNADCLFSGAIQDKNGQNIPLPQDICSGPGCPVAGQTPMIRITSRITGPKNTLSYVQAFVY